MCMSRGKGEFNMTIKDEMYKPFDTVDSRKGRGGTYDYVKWQHVADRMNEVFGVHWTSEVVWQEITGENLVVRVKVCVRDGETGEYFCQEGYGGATMRANEDAGTAHKAAYSKGLRDACKKWGVGLHLDEGGHTTAQPTMPPGYTGYETGTPPAPSAPPTPASTTPSAPVAEAPAPTAPAPSTAAPAAAPPTPSAPAPVPETPSVPATPAPVTEAPAPAPATPSTPPVPAANMGLPPTPAPSGMSAQTPPAQDASPDTPGSITEVQDMAIQNLVRLAGGEQDVTQFLAGLVTNPECELARNVATLNELSYNEAVCVIRAAKSLSN